MTRQSPDIVVILCDQLSARVLGCYGGPVPTPNIDRIAREGVLFRNASCSYPVCSPSRATLATGMYPHSHGMAWKSNGSFYDEIAVIPLLIRYPPLLRPQTCDLETGLIDLMPTSLEIADQPCPATAQGQSLVPFLTGTKPVSEARQFSFCERVPANPANTRQPGARPGASFMVRGQGWKYIRYADGSQVLYDLRHDPGETVNRIAEEACAERARTMVAALQAWLEQTGWQE